VYVTPLLGAWIADVFCGKYNTIVKLSLVYCLGHLALAFMGVGGMVQFWLLSGLGLIAIGAGGIKPCVSSHVGDQFGKNNQHLLTKIFNIFYLSINFGSVIASLCIPLILKWYGPHWAFGIPGVLMSLATFTFWMGRNKFIHVPPHGKAFYDELKSREGLTAIGKLIPLFLFVAIFWCLFDQTASTLVFQAEKMNLHLFGPDSFALLPSQIQAANPFLILILIPIFTWGIYPVVGKVVKLTPLRKIGFGLFLMVIAFGVLAFTQEAIDRGETPSVWWQLLSYVILTTGEVLVSIVCLEFAYTQAPRKMKSFVMSLYLLSVFAGNLITGVINLYIEVPTIPLVENQTHPGFDAQVDTDDDLLLKDGVIHSPVYKLLTESANAVESIYRQKNTLPTTEKGNLALANYKDPWGQPLRYTQISSTTARISSDGPDKQHLTQWDLGVFVKVNKQSKIDKNTWLYKEKKKLNMLDKVSDTTKTQPLLKTSYYAGGQTKLEGAAYFWFFTKMMLVTAIIFIPFALSYKTKTYLQE
jgi:POT family proton-dependent oligopeptide transporter